MDLIAQLTQQLGLRPDTAQAASGSVFQLIQQHAPAAAFQQLLDKAPEVSGWMSKARSAPAAGAAPAPVGGGGLGGMLGAAAGMLGGPGAGAAAGQLGALTGMLGRFGISPEMATKVLPLVLQFVQSKLGAQGTQALAAGMPLLQQFVQDDPGGMLGKRF